MKRLLIILMILGILFFQARAEDKINPDGYVKGFTLHIEPGWEIGTGKYKVSSVTQNLRLDNPFLRMAMFIPLSEKSTIFINTGLGYLKQIGTGNNYFPADELRFTKFSISVGWKIYFKNVW